MLKSKNYIIVCLILFNTVFLYCNCYAAEKVQFPRQPLSENVQFSASGGSLYFFDKEEGVVYLYNSSTGRLSRKYVISELGEDLKKER